MTPMETPDMKETASKLISIIEGIPPQEAPGQSLGDGPNPGQGLADGPQTPGSDGLDNYRVRLPIKGYYEFVVRASSPDHAVEITDNLRTAEDGKLYYRITGDETVTKL